MVTASQRTLPVKNVRVADPFWTPVQDLMVDVVLPYQADIMEDKLPSAEKSRAVENFRIAAGDTDGEFYGMVFQDSDMAKWMEAVAYALSIRPGQKLEKKADEMIALIGRAQEPDGYLDTYFTVKAPERKWKNLNECHELYCAGHMIEAAVAHYEATGKSSFINIMRRTADLICDRFGPGKIRGIPGHQEIELALIRLYNATGEKCYLDTAKYFLNERGREPDFFGEESKARDWYHWREYKGDREYNQNHLPVRRQDKAVGHSVRAVYMYTAMAAMAAETGDDELLAACETLWENVTQKQMYITGGIGATVEGEAFSFDYDLPNDTVYAETCASVAMVFFARRMLEINPSGKYADVMEKQLYNTVLSGMQLDGKRFFYVNPLEVVPGVSGKLFGHKHVLPQRPGWYACACCPPNVARLITSLGQYAWGENGKGIFNHLYLGGSAEFKRAAAGNASEVTTVDANTADVTTVIVDCESDYPFGNRVVFTVHLNRPEEFFFAVYIPSWSREFSLTVNGEPAGAELKDGYAYITRRWSEGDTVVLELTMAPRRIYANTRVREDAGCVALMRGPVVYCLEEKDNGGQLSALRLPRSSPVAAVRKNVEGIGETVVLEAEGFRMESGEELYSDTPPDTEKASFTAVPYYTWGNRGLGEMRVWIRE